MKALLAAGLLVGAVAWGRPALAQASPLPSNPVQSSSEKIRGNPAGQYVLVKTVVRQALGVVDARAEAADPEGYNLLKYCWAPANVLGDWSERAGLAGAMIVLALETQSWDRDLGRAGYPAAATAEAIGRYEAALVAAEFTEAARQRALDALLSELEGVRRLAPGATKVFKVSHCGGPGRSLALNHVTSPEGGRVRFIPYLLHKVCRAQDLDTDNPAGCDYWMAARTDGPMSFAGRMVYAIRWPDGTISDGTFDPQPSRSTGTVTLRQR
jgi:hypothetical protein